MITSTTLHSSRAKAQAIADCCNADAERELPDQRWSYVVEQRGAWFAIVVTDEDGIVLGSL